MDRGSRLPSGVGEPLNGPGMRFVKAGCHGDSVLQLTLNTGQPAGGPRPQIWVRGGPGVHSHQD